MDTVDFTLPFTSFVLAPSGGGRGLWLWSVKSRLDVTLRECDRARCQQDSNRASQTTTRHNHNQKSGF